MKRFLDLVQQRQSVRSYTNEPIEQEKLDRIFEAARLAPSACNAQPWKIIAVDQPELRHQIADAASNHVVGVNHFTKQAPVQLIIIEERANLLSSFGSWSQHKHYPHLDLGILAAHIVLAAADEGVGSCIIGWFNEQQIKKILQIPADKKVVLMILLGYSAEKLRKKRRKSLSEILSFNSYR
ncbi:MAG: nitroreductase family protein [Microbacter sp.]